MEAVDWLHQGVLSPHMAVPPPKGRMDLKERKSLKKRSSQPLPAFLVSLSMSRQDRSCMAVQKGFGLTWLPSHMHTRTIALHAPPLLTSWSTSLGHVQIHLFF